MKKIQLLFVALLLYAGLVQAQQKFEVQISKVNDTKIKIEWINPYGERVVQLNVQRSWDSVREFRTVFVPLSPELPQNGYLDATAGYAGMYYRVFYVLDDGSFFFTKSKKATTGSDFTDEVSEAQIEDKNFLVTVHDDDSVIAQLSYEDYKKFKDSIVNFTKDTLYSLTDADILLRYYNTGNTWIPSTHVYTNGDGYVQIFLMDAEQKNYRLKIMDENRKPMFSIQHITESKLMLDKTNFLHSGWFYFELYDGDKIKERNKFYIPKDF